MYMLAQKSFPSGYRVYDICVSFKGFLKNVVLANKGNDIYIYIYIYIHTYIQYLSLSLYIYIYMYTYVFLVSFEYTFGRWARPEDLCVRVLRILCIFIECIIRYLYIYISLSMYMYIYILFTISLSLSLYIYIYIYIYRERERERCTYLCICSPRRASRPGRASRRTPWARRGGGPSRSSGAIITNS